MVAAVICGFFTGSINQVSSAMISGAEEAVALTISLMGIMCLWTGIMNIAQNTGVTEFVARLLSPLLKILFPKLEDKKAKDAIVMNMTANMLGLSNAATPFGLKAMQELKRLSNGKAATDEMCMFIVINTASLQLIPTTVIAIRASLGSSNPTQIILPVWGATIAAAVSAVIATKIFITIDKRKNKIIRKRGDRSEFH